MMTLFRYLAATVVVISLTSNVSAQTGGTGGSRGTTGVTSSTGQTSTGTASTGQSGTPSSGLTGQGGTGAAAVPDGGTDASNAAQSFIGQNATQGFIGGAVQATNQQGSNRQFQAIQNNQSQQSTSQQSGTAREIRTALRVGFAFPTAPQSQINGRLADANIASMSRFSLSRPELAGIEVALNPVGTAVLTGSAPTVETRRLAANLMRLQPGIRKVDNQVVVRAN